MTEPLFAVAVLQRVVRMVRASGLGCLISAAYAATEQLSLPRCLYFHAFSTG